MTCIFDACALIAFLAEERGNGYEAVNALLEQAAAGETAICMSIVNLAEVYYGFIQKYKSLDKAGAIMRLVEDLPIQVIRAEGFNTPPPGALKKGIKPRLQYLIRTTIPRCLRRGWLIDTISGETYHSAARIKGLYSIALGDAFLCGTAKSLGAVIVTKDSEIGKPEKPESLSVMWINKL